MDPIGYFDLSAYKNIHRYADTDADSSAIHHTLGLGPNQAAKGNHNHNADYSAIGHTHTEPAEVIAHIEKNATQNFANNTSVAVTYQTVVESNPVGFADTANNRLVIPEDGDYMVEVQIRYGASGAGNRWVHLQKNGSGLRGNTIAGATGAWGNFAQVCTRLRNLAAGDLLTVIGRQDSGAALNTSTANDDTYLKAWKIN